MWKIWLVFSGICFIIEIFTVGFLVFWFGIGALIAMLASFFIENTIVQSTIFLISSAILLFATKPFVNRITKSDDSVKTNAYAIEGKTGKVIQAIDPVEGKGQIKVNGETWSAQSFDETPIPQDTTVIVERINGVKAIVKPI